MGQSCGKDSTRYFQQAVSQKGRLLCGNLAIVQTCSLDGSNTPLIETICRQNRISRFPRTSQEKPPGNMVNALRDGTPHRVIVLCGRTSMEKK